MKEYDLSVNKELRDTCMERADVLEKVKKLFLIPGMNVMTVKQVAEYFEVDVDTVKRIYQRNQSEIDSDGTCMKSYKEFLMEQNVPLASSSENYDPFQVAERKPGSVVLQNTHGDTIEIPNRGIRCFSQRAILRIAMLLRDSEVAKEVRTQLFSKENAPAETTEVPTPDRFSIIKSLVNQKFGEVRVLVEDDTVLFCGSDVAKALGYGRPNEAVARHVKGTLKRRILTKGGEQEMLFITEGDVYRLIIRSKLPAAEEFEHWLFDEMLPTLRKGGAYVTDEEKVVDTYFKNLPEDQKTFVGLMFKNLREQIEENERLSKENNGLTEINKLLSDGVNTWDNHAMINAMVRAAAVTHYHGDFGKAWGAYYKQLQYKLGINLANRNGNGSKLSKLRAEEWTGALQVGAAWLLNMGVDVVQVINTVNAAAVTKEVARQA